MKQTEALDILKMGHNVFLTGPAGSGKTFVLNKYIEFLKENGVPLAVTASTGIAATHMNGVTIHSWSGVGIRKELSDFELDALLQKQYLAKRFQNTKVLIIDEVSMLDHNLFDLVDKVCREFKQNEMPFGGMQVVLSGDFFQLPPISRGNEQSNFIHKSQAWEKMNLKVCYLEEQHRQNDDELLGLLNNIRDNKTGEEVLVPLRKRYRRAIEGGLTPTKLYTHNIDIDNINNAELEKIEGYPSIFEMKTKGKSNLVESLKKSCIAPERLLLKVGAVVMFIKNNQQKGYANGTLGTVVDFDVTDLPIVETYEGKRIYVDYEDWVIEDDGKIKASISQIPLRLAWAITIHKSQGMSLDAAEIDLSKSFVEGMGYVALSRVRTLGGLRLLGLNKIALEVNKDILEFDKKLKEISHGIVEELRAVSKKEIEKIHNFFVEKAGGEKPVPKVSTYEETKALVEKKMTIEEMAKERGLVEGTIVSHLEKLREDGDVDLEYLKKDFDKKKLKKIIEAFKKSEDKKLSVVKEILGDDFSYEEIRMGRLFLE